MNCVLQVEEKKQKVAEAAAKKRANKVDAAAKELLKWQVRHLKRGD